MNEIGENQQQQYSFLNKTSQEIDGDFSGLLQSNQEVSELLGNDASLFQEDDKIALIQAYQNNGIAGIKDIIEDDDNSQDLNLEQQILDEVQQNNSGFQANGNSIEQQFLNIYETDQYFRDQLSEEALALDVEQKQQIIDAYNQNGTQGVLEMLQNHQELSENNADQQQ